MRPVMKLYSLSYERDVLSFKERPELMELQDEILVG
jgi:hypothetical protein